MPGRRNAFALEDDAGTGGRVAAGGPQYFPASARDAFCLADALRSFEHELAGVSPSINAILEKIGATPGIHRKDLAEQLIPAQNEDAEKRKLTLASDLHWLISEGYVIEFNDGSLDLPRVKAPNEPKKDSPSETIPTIAPVKATETQALEPSAPATTSA